MPSFLRRFLGESSGALLVRKLGIALSSDFADDASAPTIDAGAGAPDDADGAPDGSVWLRNDGTSATTIYAKASGAYSAVSADASDFGDTGIATDVVAESTSAAGVTVDGLRIQDATIKPASGGSAFIDLSAVATGEGDVVLKDNLADAMTIREATNAYLTVTTTNDAERVSLGKLLAMPVTTVNMNDAAHALVLGTAGAGETKLTGNLVVCDPNSGGASEDLTLPAEASMTGVMLMIVNSGGEGIVVKDDGAGTVVTLDTAQHGLVFCDGTTWRGFIGSIT